MASNLASNLEKLYQQVSPILPKTITETIAEAKKKAGFSAGKAGMPSIAKALPAIAQKFAGAGAEIKTKQEQEKVKPKVPTLKEALIKAGMPSIAKALPQVEETKKEKFLKKVGLPIAQKFAGAGAEIKTKQEQENELANKLYDHYYQEKEVKNFIDKHFNRIVNEGNLTPKEYKWYQALTNIYNYKNPEDILDFFNITKPPKKVEDVLGLIYKRSVKNLLYSFANIDIQTLKAMRGGAVKEVTKPKQVVWELLVKPSLNLISTKLMIGALNKVSGTNITPLELIADYDNKVALLPKKKRLSNFTKQVLNETGNTLATLIEFAIAKRLPVLSLLKGMAQATTSFAGIEATRQYLINKEVENALKKQVIMPELAKQMDKSVLLAGAKGAGAGVVMSLAGIPLAKFKPFYKLPTPVQNYVENVAVIGSLNLYNNALEGKLPSREDIIPVLVSSAIFSLASPLVDYKAYKESAIKNKQYQEILKAKHKIKNQVKNFLADKKNVLTSINTEPETIANMVVDTVDKEGVGLPEVKSKTIKLKEPIPKVEKAQEFIKELIKPTEEVNLPEETIEPVEISARLPEEKGIVGNIVKDVSYGKDKKVDLQYKVIPINDLITSNKKSYPKEYQPREREKTAYQLQVEEMSKTLDPRRLVESYTATEGSPIVVNNIVLSGNGRGIAISKAYEIGKAENYRNYLIEKADELGINPEEVKKIKNPVLVREIVNPEKINLKDFVIKANETDISHMSEYEKAKVDSKKISDDLLQTIEIKDNGEIGMGSIGKILGVIVPKSELNTVISPDNKLSPQGERRIKNAILTKAYGEHPIIARIIESMDINIRNIGNGLLKVAPKISKMKAEIKKGNLYDLDITDDLINAITLLSDLKAKGQTVKYLKRQTDMFNEIDEHILNLADNLSNYSRSAKKISDLLSDWVDSVYEIGNPKQMDIFAEKPKYNSMTVFENVLKNFIKKEGKYEEPENRLFGTTETKKIPSEVTEGKPTEEVNLPEETKPVAKEKLPETEVKELKTKPEGKTTLGFMGTGVLQDLIEQFSKMIPELPAKLIKNEAYRNDLVRRINNFFKRGIGVEVVIDRANQKRIGQFIEQMFYKQIYLNDIKNYFDKNNPPDEVKDNVYDVVVGNLPLDILPDELQVPVKSAREMIDKFSKILIAIGGKSKAVKEVIKLNLEKYLSRRYELFEKKFFEVKDEDIDAFIVDLREYYKQLGQEALDKANKKLQEAEELPQEDARILKMHAGRYKKQAQRLFDYANQSQDFYRGLVKSKLNEKTPFLFKGRQKIRVSQQRFMRRKKLTDSYRKMIGEIKDPVILLDKTITDMARMVSNATFFDFIKKNKDWWSDKPSDEKGLIYKLEGDQFGNLTRDEKGKPRAVFVDQKMFDFLNQITTQATGNVGKLFDAIAVKPFKIMAVPMNIPAHSRQIINNLIVSLLLNNNPLLPKNWKYYKQASNILKDVTFNGGRNVKDIWGELLRYRIVGTEFTPSETDYNLTKDFYTHPVEYADKISSIMEKGKMPIKFFSRLYGMEDSIFKIATYLKLKDEGLSPANASYLVDRRFYNYDNVPEVVKWLREVPVFGVFITFKYETGRIFKNYIEDIQAMLKKDKKEGLIMAGRLATVLGSVVALQQLLPSLFQAYYNSDEVDQEQAQRFVELVFPEYQKRNTIEFHRDKQNNIRFIDLSYVFPLQDYQEILASLTDAVKTGNLKNLSGVLSAIDLLEHPLAEVYNIFKNNYSPRRRKEISNEYDPFINQIINKTGAYINALGFPPPYIQRIISAIKGTEDYYGRKYELKTELKSLVTGLKSNLLYPEALMKARLNKYLYDYANLIYDYRRKIKNATTPAQKSELDKVYKHRFSELDRLLYELGSFDFIGFKKYNITPSDRKLQQGLREARKIKDIIPLFVKGKEKGKIEVINKIIDDIK